MAAQALSKQQAEQTAANIKTVNDYLTQLANLPQQAPVAAPAA